jgi:hypothetical protein
VNPISDPLLLRKSGSAGNCTWDLWTCSQELLPPDHRSGLPENHKHINCIWNKKGLPHQWKESIIVPNNRKFDKTDCNNYHGVSQLLTSYKILYNTLLSGSSP